MTADDRHDFMCPIEFGYNTYICRPAFPERPSRWQRFTWRWLWWR